MKSHLRLWRITMPEKRAVISVDYFYVGYERTVAWIALKRLDDGNILYTLRDAGSKSIRRGAAPGIRAAVERVTEMVRETYGEVEHPIGYLPNGDDNMGLWVALGDDSGLAQE